MSSLEEEVLQLKSYFKHHRIVTYAILGFVVLTSVITSASLRSLSDEKTLQSRAADNANQPPPSCSYENSCGHWDSQPDGNRGLNCSTHVIVRCTCGTYQGKSFDRFASGAKCGAADWNKVAVGICGCPDPTPIPPTATPSPTSDPKLSCGINCYTDDSTDYDSCKIISPLLTCIVTPCKGICPATSQKKGLCGGAVCIPIPTTEPNYCGTKCPPACKGTGYTCIQSCHGGVGNNPNAGCDPGFCWKPSCGNSSALKGGQGSTSGGSGASGNYLQ